ncbi:MAG: transposase [Nitrospira sp.]
MTTCNSKHELTNIQDPLLRNVGFANDLAGRITTQTLPDTRTIGYAYDANGNVTGITPPGRPIHQFNYTPVDLVSNYNPPDTGFSPRNTQYAYNVDRQLTTVTRPDGQTIQLGYEPTGGRLSTLTLPGSQVMTYAYGATTGTLNSITAPGSTLSYTYDGSLLKNTTWSGTVTGSVGRNYDNNFRITSQSVNGGNTINFGYDDDSLLTSETPKGVRSYNLTDDLIGCPHMARPLRIEYPGAVYHVTSRGNARQAIVQDDRDRTRFLETLAHVIDRFGWRCHAYCLMDNHYHLLLETPQPNLSRGMRQLNGTYTQALNCRHQRVGHVFQGRFTGILVEKEAHLLELCRYVVLNPVRARMVTHPRLWAWSSYQATVGEHAAPSWLWTDWILGHFGTRQREAQGRYRQFVAEGEMSRRPGHS